MNAFVIKFENSGAKRLYSSYVGGSKAESGNAIAVHGTGTVYITGSTASTDFPNALAIPLVGQTDSFVTVIDTTASGPASVVASRLLGGVGDVAKAIAVDATGNIYVGGSLRDATPFPTTPNAFSSGTQPPNLGFPGFLTKLDPAATQLLYSTKVPSGDVKALGLDSGARVFVTGDVFFGSVLLVTPVRNGGGCEACAFVAEFDTTKFQSSSLLYSGGFSLGYITQANGIAVEVNAPGQAYVVGAIVPQLSSDPTRAFMATVETMITGATAIKSTVFAAGSVHDFATAVALDPGVNLYITGTTTPFPPQINDPPPDSSRAFAVALTPHPPVELYPAAGSGGSQAFIFSYTDLDGYQDISGSQILIGSSSSPANACYILFGRSNGVIALADDTGQTFSTTTLGSPAVLQNSQCSVVASLSSQSGFLNTLTLTVLVIFKPAFAGPKNVYSGFTNNAGARSEFAAAGTFAASAALAPPSVVAVGPSIGSGQAQGFSFTYADPLGYPDISGSQILFNSTPTPVNGCYILFGRGTNLIALGSDDGNSFTPAILGSQTTLQNSQCIVYPGNSGQSTSVTNQSVTVFVAFKASFAGTKNIYSGVTTNGGTRSSFDRLGTWTVPSEAPALSIFPVPVPATGSSQTLTFIYADPNGFADILGSQVIVNPTQSLTNSCYIQFTRATGTIALAGDDGVSTTSAILGQPAFLQNSQCIVNASASYQAGTGNYLSLTVFITPKLSGAKAIYSSVTSSMGTNSGILQVGFWQFFSPATLTPVSVSPATGAGPAGTNQYFTFTFSDPNGANDISGSQIIFNPALQGAGACYVLYGRGNNLLALASDDANTFTNGTLGSAGTLQNSQCSIDLAKSFQVQTGPAVNLTIAVNFKPAYRQLMYVFSNVVNNAGTASAFPSLGTFVVQ